MALPTRLGGFNSSLSAHPAALAVPSELPIARLLAYFHKLTTKKRNSVKIDLTVISKTGNCQIKSWSLHVI